LGLGFRDLGALNCIFTEWGSRGEGTSAYGCPEIRWFWWKSELGQSDPLFLAVFGREDEVCFATVEGEVLVLERDVYKVPDLEGKIVLIESADPGFDWLFSHGIVGFITCFGGANSHMAIRASELEIPAVVGVGEVLFECLKNANTVLIDCVNEKIEIIK
jgi:phosphohistidine swiveling domain-containing protein